VQKLYNSLEIKDDTAWAQISSELKDNGVFLAVEDPDRRKEIFMEVQTARLEEIAVKRTVLKAESDFRILLRGTPSPPP